MTKHTNSPVPAPQWWKHLKWCKRVFWKRDRQAQKKEVKEP